MAVGQDDWSKVKDLKSGTELRIFKHGSAQPVIAKAADANDNNLIVVQKNEEVAIPKADIDRIDFRPAGQRRPATTETHEKVSDPAAEPGGVAHPRPAAVPGVSSSGTVSFGAKPDFQRLYTRHAEAPAQK